MLTAQLAAEQFDLGGRIREAMPYGQGLINDTFLVTIDSELGRAIVQRINQQVFPQPALIMENLRTVLDHIGRRQAGVTPEARGELRMPVIYQTRDGKDFYLDGTGGFWRAMSFIENTHSSQTISDLAQAEEVGFALGRFHGLLNDLDPGQLHDTLPGFHISPLYLERFNTVAAQRKVSPNTPELRFCFGFIEARKDRTGVLEAAKSKGLIAVRVIHGDPKLSNILFDEGNGLAVSVIDLDTVKPGLIHYDVGDCLRSCCNTAGESPQGHTAVNFDLDICQAILKRYFPQVRRFLTEQDYAYMYEAIRLIPFELGLRFLTDYLEGNTYFKVARAEQNLYRAVTQFQLTAQIEQQESRIRQLITGCGGC